MADGKYLIGESLREKLKSTIAKVDSIPFGGPVSRIPTIASSDGPTYVPKVFRVCTFTGAWAINTEKTVTFRGVTATPNTVSATNLVCGLSPAGSCDVSIAKDGTAWYLVQPNLTQQPGYSASGTQVLTIVNGNLTWISTTTADAIVSATLGTAGLVFTRARIQVVSTATASQVSIGTTACT